MLHPHLTATDSSYRVDETYIKIKQQWYYLLTETSFSCSRLCSAFEVRWTASQEEPCTGYGS